MRPYLANNLNSNEEVIIMTIYFLLWTKIVIYNDTNETSSIIIILLILQYSAQLFLIFCLLRKILLFQIHSFICEKRFKFLNFFLNKDESMEIFNNYYINI